jgi:hypothetical protein
MRHADLRDHGGFARLVCADAAALPGYCPIAAWFGHARRADHTYFSFFTILTNLLVALVFTAVAMRAAAFSSPSVQGGTAVYIAIVGIVYQLLLRQLWNPQGAQLLADMLLHAVIPLGYVVYWLIFAPRTGLRWMDAVVWLVYPGVYLIYVLARGAVSGLYPYPFVDVNVLGYAGVLARAAVLMAVFLGMGLLLVAVSRWMRLPKGWIQPSLRE